MLPKVDGSIAEAFRRGAGCADLRTRRVTVMGLGRLGGGIGVVQYLIRQGAAVTVTDLSPADELRNSLQAIDSNALVGLHLGEHPPSDFTSADLVVVNPAVKRNSPLLKLAAESGAALTSEINLFWKFNPAKTVAVTGTVGKSTTAGLIHAMLCASGVRSYLGGNIGRSLLTDLEQLRSDDVAVVELSSFQLWDLAYLDIAPDVAVVTNFFPNHLDWHGSIEDYRQSKQAIMRRQRADQLCVLNADLPELSAWQGEARRVTFGRANRVDAPPSVVIDDDGVSVRDLSGRLARIEWNEKLCGADQAENVAAAVAAAVFGCGVHPKACRAGLDAFRPLAHRRQLVGEWQGRRFINDSKATTPQAAIAALKALREPGRRLLLIAGGADKGIELHAFAHEIGQCADRVALLGQTGPHLAAEIARHQHHRSIALAQHSSLHTAFAWLMEDSRPGDAVLLSPGCASFGDFRNFEQRGDCFARLAQEWITLQHSQ